MYSDSDRAQICEIRVSFHKGLPFDRNYIQPEVLESWERSKGYGVDPHNFKSPILSEEELKKRITSHSLLYNTALPILESLYAFVKGSGFLAILSDEEGYVLKIIGDDDILEKSTKKKLVEGCNRAEKWIGTNAIGTCQAIKKPIQVWSGEHFCSDSLDWTCSGAPIVDMDDTIIGTLCLTSTWDKVHEHTLGMVVASVEAISRQIKMQQAYDEVFDMKNKLGTIIETLPAGVILLDGKQRITQVNQLAISILQTNESKLIGSHIGSFVKTVDFRSLKQNIYDSDIDFELDGTVTSYNVSIVLVDKAMNHKHGIVITLRKVKHVRKLLNQIVGSYAHFNFEDIIGESPKIKEVIGLAKIAAKYDATVLLTGQSGTGKELFAQAIHNSSNYSNGPFVAINCGALPRSLIESELFGYEKGSFTGANKEGQAGKFELANEGTIFLDEIGEMPMDVQVSLLRVIQNREVSRIGGKKTISINVRIIAASNKDLELSMENKQFRSDLFYRLNVFSIKIPSLNERDGDIPILTDYFLSKCSQRMSRPIFKAEPEVYRALEAYYWKGNLRELENTIERSALIANKNTLTMGDLPNNITEANTPKKVQPEIETTDKLHSPSSNNGQTMTQMEREKIIEGLNLYKGNIKKTAETLGMSRRTLYRKMNKFQIDYQNLRSE